jgi:hypothetical protein
MAAGTRTPEAQAALEAKQSAKIAAIRSKHKKAKGNPQDAPRLGLSIPIKQDAESIGRLGGRSKSPEKIAAVRRNGAKGGRPKNERTDGWGPQEASLKKRAYSSVLRLLFRDGVAQTPISRAYLL